MQRSKVQRGKVLGDKYRLESVLGRGGMGSVWRAEHLGFGAPVAVKLMDPALALTPDALARFHKEAHAAATIRSPHVVQVLDHGVDEPTSTPFIVMELLDGETLGERLAREGTLPWQRTAEIITDVCRALTRAHQAGVVHRDLKPDNIFLVKDEREFAKVLDFGVAKSRSFAARVGKRTSTGPLFGTPCYMSPEQINGSRDVDGRSDLWSVAVIACECITGRCPFEGETLSQLLLAICTQPAPPASSLGTVSPALDSWFARAFQRDPALRFQTARELSEALSAACGSPAPAASLREAGTRALFAHDDPSRAGDPAFAGAVVVPDQDRRAPSSGGDGPGKRTRHGKAALVMAGAGFAVFSLLWTWLSSRATSQTVEEWARRPEPPPGESVERRAPALADVMPTAGGAAIAPPNVTAPSAIADEVASPESTPGELSKRRGGSTAAPKPPRAGVVRRASRVGTGKPRAHTEPPPPVTLESALQGDRGRERK